MDSFAGAQEGIVTTRQFFVNAWRVNLAVNANAGGGSLAV
jgi:hypothetical protein